MHLHRQNIPSIQLLSNYLLNVNLISTKYQVLSGYLEYLPFKLKNLHSSIKFNCLDTISFVGLLISGLVGWFIVGHVSNPGVRTPAGVIIPPHYVPKIAKDSPKNCPKLPVTLHTRLPE